MKNVQKNLDKEQNYLIVINILSSFSIFLLWIDDIWFKCRPKCNKKKGKVETRTANNDEENEYNEKKKKKKNQVKYKRPPSQEINNFNAPSGATENATENDNINHHQNENATEDHNINHHHNENATENQNINHHQKIKI